MAQTIQFNVTVSTEAEARRLEQALAQLRSAGATGSRPVATPRVVSPAVRAAESLGRVIGSTVRAPFDVARSSSRLAEASLLSFLGPMARLGVVAVTSPPTLIACTLAAVTLGPAILSFALTLKLMRLSFGWAEEAADAQLQILARTRRTFPAAIGEAFDRAEDTILVKLGVASALFGKSADALATTITRRFADAQMQRGLRGEKDIFSRWGITPEAVQIFETMKGERIGLTDWLALFIRKREEFDAQQMSAGAGTPAEAYAIKARGQLVDDSMKLFGQRFADLVGTLSSDDLKRLNDNIRKTVPLVAVEDADRKSQEFSVALMSVKGTFTELKRGIAGDLMPTYTEIMENLRNWLLSTGDDGRSLGLQFRDLTSSVALHGWETLKILMDEINPDTVKVFIDEIKGWQPQETIRTLRRAATLVIGFSQWLAGAVHRFTTPSPGALEIHEERMRRQAARGTWAFSDYLPAFIPGAPGYEGYLRDQARQDQYIRDLAAAKKAGLPLPEAPSFQAAPPPAAPPPMPPPPAAVAAPTNAAGGLQIAPGYHPILSREDPRVMDALNRAQAFLPPGYTARATSGFRGNNPRSQHFTGTAIDIQIYDEQGRPIANRGGDVTGLYTRYARAAYGYIIDRHPELRDRFAWGGAFGTSSRRPNEPDLMHFDIGGMRGRISQYRLDRLGPLRAGEPVTAALAQPAPSLTAGRQVIPPEMQTPENMAALKEVADRFGLSPMAIAGIINTESKWRLGATTGSYRGLTQIGPENPEWATIGSMSAADQIRTYGRWLERYKFREKTNAAGVNIAAMSPAQQAAYLQGFQFAPNALGWQYAAGRGEFGVRTTASRQARALGSTSLAEMTRYYQGLLGPETETARLTAKPPEKVLQEGTAAGEAAARAFKQGIEDVKIPLRSLSEEEKERERKRADREVLSI